MLFSEQDRVYLRRQHIARAWFVELFLPSGILRYHNGVGTVNLDSKDWLGVSNPLGGQLVSVSSVESPRFGSAAKVDITLSGVTPDFMASLRSLGNSFEGNECNIYWCAFDQETQQSIITIKKLFKGQLSSPKFFRQGVAGRFISFAIESPFHAQNYPFGGMWNGASQRRRFPTDKGLDYMGVEFQERIQ